MAWLHSIASGEEKKKDLVKEKKDTSQQCSLKDM